MFVSSVLLVSLIDWYVYTLDRPLLVMIGSNEYAKLIAVIPTDDGTEQCSLGTADIASVCTSSGASWPHPATDEQAAESLAGKSSLCCDLTLTLILTNALISFSGLCISSMLSRSLVICVYLSHDAALMMSFTPSDLN